MDKTTPAPKKAPAVRDTADSNPEVLEIVVRGHPDAVRRAVHEMQFRVGWDQGTARLIALDKTGIDDANLDDELGGPKIRMFSPEVRAFYRDACCKEAGKLGHPVPEFSKVDSDSDTTIMKVGDMLYDAAKL